MCCKGVLEPERLPPTERCAYFHGLRVHQQIITWSLLDSDDNFFLKGIPKC